MRLGLSNPLFLLIGILHLFLMNASLVSRWLTKSLNQSLDLGPSSQITTPNFLGGLIIFEGFKNVNLLSLINDYPFLD